MKECREEVIDIQRYVSQQLNFLDFLNLPKHVTSIEFIKGLIPKIEIRYEIWNGDMPNIIQEKNKKDRIESRKSIYEIHVKEIDLIKDLQWNQ